MTTTAGGRLAEAAVAEMAVRRRGMDLTVEFDEGAELGTEISAKFRRRGLAAELAAAGLEMTGWWTDPAADFAVSLSVRA